MTEYIIAPSDWKKGKVILRAFSYSKSWSLVDQKFVVHVRECKFLQIYNNYCLLRRKRGQNQVIGSIFCRGVIKNAADSYDVMPSE